MTTLHSCPSRQNVWTRSALFLGICGVLTFPPERALSQGTPVLPPYSEEAPRFRKVHFTPAARATWIESQGLQKNFLAIRALIDSLSPNTYSSSANHVAQELAVLYSRDEISRLQARGIDVVRPHLGYKGVKESPDEFVDRTDVMVIGEVIDYNTRAYDRDEYASTITVLVHEVLKGDTTLDTVRIRQFSGQTGNYGRSSTIDVIPVLHRRYLFQISHRLYPLYTVQQGGTPLNGHQPLYVVQTPPREISKEGRLEQPSACLMVELAKHSLQDIRTSLLRYKGL